MENNKRQSQNTLPMKARSSGQQAAGRQANSTSSSHLRDRPPSHPDHGGVMIPSQLGHVTSSHESKLHDGPGLIAGYVPGHYPLGPNLMLGALVPAPMVGPSHDAHLHLTDDKQERDTMTTLVKVQGKEGYDIRTLPTPIPDGDDVLIKVDAVGLGRMDAELFSWTNAASSFVDTFPFTPGHECTGTILKRGPLCKLQIGTRVVIENHFPCGVCYHCQHTMPYMCQNVSELGYGNGLSMGACAEFLAVSSKQCYQLQKDISYDEAVLLEPMTVAYRAIKELDVEHQDVLIIGAGCLGLLGCLMARHLGANKITVAARDKAKLLLVKEFGALEVMNLAENNLTNLATRLTNGVGFSRVCEMSGSSDMINTMFKALRPGGKIVMVGLPTKPLHIEDVARDIIGKNLSLATVYGRQNFEVWKEMEELISEEEFSIAKVISHRFLMTSYKDAFKTLLGGKATKVILYPDHRYKYLVDKNRHSQHR